MAKKILVDLDMDDALIKNISAGSAAGEVIEFSQYTSGLATKHQSLSSTGTIEVDGASLNVILSEEGAVLDQITVSGETSYFNVAYNIVKNSSGVKLKARFNQSGATLHYNAAPEAMQKLTLDCTNNNLDVQVSVLKYTGYLIRSGDNFTWATGSTGGEFHYYYWNSTDKIFVAYCATDSEWIAVDLDNATNATDFIADLNATGSQAGYIEGGETFTATSSHRELIGSAKDDYVDDTAAHVPASSLAKVTHSGDSDWTEYFYMDSTSRKILGYDDENGYWALWLLSSDADFSSEPADNASLSMASSGAFDLITTSSDDYGDGINIPDAGHSNITYSGTAGSVPYLNTTSGLAVEVEETLAGTANKIASSSAVKTYVDEIDGNVDDLITLSGVAENATHLGEFTGSTIADNQTVKAAIQALETKADANAVTVTEIDGNVDDLVSLSGVAENASNLGEFSGSTIDDDSTIKEALQALETKADANAVTVTEIDGNVDDLISLSGVAENATHLGTFTGTTIADNSTVKAALQALETEAESNNLTVAAGSSSLLSISGNEISVSSLLLTDVTVNTDATDLADYISNNATEFAGLEEGDILIMTGATDQTKRSYIHNGGTAGGAADMTRMQVDLNVDTIRAMFSAGAGLTYNATTGVFNVGADQIKDTMIDWGTGATQINAGDIPLESYSWARITNPTDIGDALEKMDADLAAVAGGAISINNGIGTNGESDGSVDVRVDDSSIEIDGSNNVSIKDLGVTTAMLAADAVTSAKIADDQVDSEHIAAGAIDLEHMSANSVDSDQYVDGSIDTAHIANAAVTHEKLCEDCVDGDNIQDDAVNSEHIADGAIDLAHMSANSVDSAQYVDGSIDNVHIADGTITAAKLADDYMVRVLSTATWTAGEAKVITHNLGSKYVHVTVFDDNDNHVIPDFVGTSSSTATITISVAGDYTVLVSG
ncbi:MAG: hypothetical protein CMJ82_10945 [Planctomycetaceae bacterium]|nr:hypothetical protein [Planctomycetaceae bacterium]|tara:strand:- start:3764 stop:6610 length:2847 start_codon:yes stop_codon:yes gene_type:complete